MESGRGGRAGGCWMGGAERTRLAAAAWLELWKRRRGS